MESPQDPHADLRREAGLKLAAAVVAVDNLIAHLLALPAFRPVCHDNKVVDHATGLPLSAAQHDAGLLPVYAAQREQLAQWASEMGA